MRCIQASQHFLSCLTAKAHYQPSIGERSDPDALTFELSGMILAANTDFVLRQDPATLKMAGNVVRRRLGATA